MSPLFESLYLVVADHVDAVRFILLLVLLRVRAGVPGVYGDVDWLINGRCHCDFVSGAFFAAEWPRTRALSLIVEH